MKILLVQPPCNIIKTKLERKFAVHPLGLAYIAAVLRQNKYDLEILDCVVNDFETEIPVRKDFIRYGMPHEKIVSEIRRVRPDVVGVSAIQSIRKWESLEVCKAAKEVDPKIVTIMGGTYPSCFTEEALSFPELDIAVIGEGEETILELLKAIENKGKGFDKIQGIGYKENGKVRINPRTRLIEDLDKIPYPAWDMFPMKAYSTVGVGTGSFGTKHYCLMETSRGCPHNCHYCGKNIVKGFGYRVRSVDNVLGEMKMLVDNFQIEEIQFEDYNCLSDMDRWVAICEGIVKNGLKFSWSMPHGMQVKLLNKELLELFKRSGCDTLYLAIESANQPYLDEMGKGVKVDYAKDIVEIAQGLGIAVCGYFMIGVLGETRQDIQRTIEYALSLKIDDVGFFIANPIPGSRFFEKIKKEGKFVDGFDPSHIRYSMANIKSPEWTSADLQRLRHAAWQENRKRNMDRVQSKFGKDFKTNIFLSEADSAFQCF